MTGERAMNRREAVAAALTQVAPRLPDFETEAVIDRALASPGLRNARPDNAAWLALVAYARHVFTEYDDLLAEGYDRDSARHFVLDDLNAALAAWGSRRRVSEEETAAQENAGEENAEAENAEAENDETP